MISISDCPIELLIDNLFPILPVRDMLALGATNKFFYTLCQDDTMWKRRLEKDLNFSGSRTARNTGWKIIYKGLSRPKVYVWGQSDQGRLGLPRKSIPRAHIGDVPYPIRLNIPGSRIVDLAAGGWSFHALDSQGNVYVWGTLNANMVALHRDGFAVPEKEAETPLRLELPSPVRQISCGRSHSMAFDTDNRLWMFLSWGRPFRLITAVLDGTSPDSTPMQIDCGWTFSSVLTQSGDAYVWITSLLREDDRFKSKMDEMDAEKDKEAFPTEDGVIPCATWDYDINPFRVPALPSLPDFENPGKSAVNVQLVKIAAMEHSLMGLTNKGHVLKYDDVQVTEIGTLGGRWTYLPNFSEVNKIQELPEFSHSEGSEDKRPLPQDLRITHISAHFRTFVAYSHGSNGVVLLGHQEAKEDSAPRVIPSLQNRSVISVVLGDYHFAALTSDGKLFSWGAFSKGALGLGDPYFIPLGQPGAYANEERRQRALKFGSAPPDVEVPMEINFNYATGKKRETFCFATAAAGWHTAALVIDLDDNTDDDDDDPSSNIPGSFPQDEIQGPNHPAHGPGEMPAIPIGRGYPLPYRIGLAGGRGRHRGIWRGAEYNY